jgi:hypothetical protein
MSSDKYLELVQKPNYFAVNFERAASLSHAASKSKEGVDFSMQQYSGFIKAK